MVVERWTITQPAGYPPARWGHVADFDGSEAPLRVTRESDYEALADQLRGAMSVLEWLVSMDDPDDVTGQSERQIVTLTKIIERARIALGRQ